MPKWNEDTTGLRVVNEWEPESDEEFRYHWRTAKRKAIQRRTELHRQVENLNDFLEWTNQQGFEVRLTVQRRFVVTDLDGTTVQKLIPYDIVGFEIWRREE